MHRKIVVLGIETWEDMGPAVAPNVDPFSIFNERTLIARIIRESTIPLEELYEPAEIQDLRAQTLLFESLD